MSTRDARQTDRSRSRSPYRESHSHSHSHRHKRRRTEDPKPPAVLPLHARQLSKHDFRAYEALFALYLDVQKEIRLEDLDEKEVKGRWKSFLGKWNRGELAEGWYDAATKQRADEAALGSYSGQQDDDVRPRPEYETRQRHRTDPHEERSEDEDDDFGPTLPVRAHGTSRAGPSIPNAQDLELAAELRAEDRAHDLADLRYSRKADRTLQKERLEELVPRADPGSRERQLEKKREVAVTNAGFREAKESGDVEVKESDLMGDDGIEGYKKHKKDQERKKNERELRREEQLRVRQAEREERLKSAREKEAKTMEYLKALAKERYG